MKNHKATYILAAGIGAALLAIITLFWLFFIPHGNQTTEKIDDVRLRLVPKIHQVMKTYYEDMGEYPAIDSKRGNESLNVVNLGNDAENIVLAGSADTSACRTEPMTKTKACFVSTNKACEGHYTVIYWNSAQAEWTSQQTNYAYGEMCAPTGANAPETTSSTTALGNGEYPAND